MPTPKEIGLLEVNKQYQEVIKTVITLVTASLVLPIVFLKNILGLDGKPFKDYPYATLGYISWILLAASLLGCVAFHVSSTKYTKAIYEIHGEDKTKKLAMESWRDGMAWVAALSGVFGLASLLTFFLKGLSL